MFENRETIIPEGTAPEKMPSGLLDLYMSHAFGNDGSKLTEAHLKTLLHNIRKGKKLGLWLHRDPDLEGDYLEIEIDSGLISFQYVENDGTEDACFYSSFDPAYLDSDEESPMKPADGQSVMLMRYTMRDPELAAKCVEYFARTGELYPGMAWLKG